MACLILTGTEGISRGARKLTQALLPSNQRKKRKDVGSELAYHEHLGDVASTKDFVNSSKFMGFMGWEIGRERAFLSTPSPQKLTCGTRCDCVQCWTQNMPPSHLIKIRCIYLSLDLLPYLIKSLPNKKPNKINQTTLDNFKKSLKRFLYTREIN